MGNLRNRAIKMPEIQAPMTLREQFMNDPFFNSKLSKTSSNSSSSSISSSSSTSSSSRISGGSTTNSSLMSDRNLLNNSFPKHKDGHLLGLKEDSSKLEISLNTSGYKPQELQVNVSDDEVKVEGKHEERSEDGELMVERNFCKTYTLPQGAVKEKVESNLSDDGVMVISVPKKKHIKEVFCSLTKKGVLIVTVPKQRNVRHTVLSSLV